MNTTHRLAAILAADVVGYSRGMDIDEVATLRALKAHRRVPRLPRITGVLSKPRVTACWWRLPVPSMPRPA
jgi:hypothetical protein